MSPGNSGCLCRVAKSLASSYRDQQSGRDKTSAGIDDLVAVSNVSHASATQRPRVHRASSRVSVASQLARSSARPPRTAASRRRVSKDGGVGGSRVAACMETRSPERGQSHLSIPARIEFLKRKSLSKPVSPVCRTVPPIFLSVAIVISAGGSPRCPAHRVCFTPCHVILTSRGPSQ